MDQVHPLLRQLEVDEDIVLGEVDCVLTLSSLASHHAVGKDVPFGPILSVTDGEDAGGASPRLLPQPVASSHRGGVQGDLCVQLSESQTHLQL